MNIETSYDIAITGGGLAGLALSIQLAQAGFSVVLFEKERYPFHKVCGEYISMESWNFLQSLGLPLDSLMLPKIDTLELSAPDGRKLTTPLPLGGFGISRYKLDAALALIAREKGVCLQEETKVEEIVYNNETFYLTYRNKNGIQKINATVCCGAFGKRSNLDVKWKRNFLQNTNPRINNYVGVKYHVKTQRPSHIISLHNFENGYCGISQIEEAQYCLCYLTKADNFRKSKQSVQQMEKEILCKNPHLKELFETSEFLPGFPVTISQISFSSKSQVENHVLLLGDSAGMITPLCGNGMSMALHSSKIAAGCVAAFLQHKLSRQAMEERYKQEWRKQFSARMKTGRILQYFFGNPRLSNWFVFLFQLFPFLSKGIIKKTHGQPF